jgi:hypothetical protein
VDDLIMLQSLLPTPDDLLQIKKATTVPNYDPNLSYAPAELFIQYCANQQDLSTKVLSFIFKLQLFKETVDIQKRLDAIITLCQDLKASTGLKKLLKIVLELGNLTNYEYGANNASGVTRAWMAKDTRAIGFKIEGLARLRDVKSSDGKWSLMTFLVDMLNKNYPEVYSCMFFDLQSCWHCLKNL